MENTFFKLLWVISSSVMLLSGLLLITDTSIELLSINILYSLILFTIGFCNIFAYLNKKDLLIEPSLVMKEGIIEAILAMLLFFTHSQNLMLIIYFFAAYFTYKAISVILIASKHMDNKRLFISYIILSAVTLINSFTLIFIKLMYNIPTSLLFGFILIIESYLIVARLIINVLYYEKITEY
jgi:uncharacterized membrane protein HdeD (DUF308 family)